jgi:predicted DNA-binding protein YlxM (UPF0122 family)
MNDEILRKREEATALYDAYKGLLTSVQKDVYSDYYLYDLSLSEIAENRKISRAAVNDALKKGYAKLEEAEKEVGLLQKKKTLEGLSLDVENAKDEPTKTKALTALEEYIHHGL